MCAQRRVVEVAGVLAGYVPPVLVGDLVGEVGHDEVCEGKEGGGGKEGGVSTRPCAGEREGATDRGY